MTICTMLNFDMRMDPHNLFTNSLDGGGRSGAGRFLSNLEPEKESQI